MIGPIQLSEIENLAPMPASVTRLAGMLVDPDASVNDIVRVIEFDQALTANLLRWANSAWSGSQTPILTVRASVIRMGTAQILKIAVGRRILGPMNRSLPEYGLGEQELWRHSVAAALSAECLDKFISKPVPGTAFTASLLHDIGKLFLSRYLSHEVIDEIRKLIEDERITYVEAENRLLGTDHAKVGGAIARHWKFPEQIAGAIERHHDPDPQPDPVQDIVYIANIVAKHIGVGLGSEQMNLKASFEAPKRMGLSSFALERLCAMVVVELAKTEKLWEG